MRNYLNNLLRLLNTLNFDSIQKYFTVADNGTVVTAEISYTSVSIRIYIPEKVCTPCLVHVLNKGIISVFNRSMNKAVLHKFVEEFRIVNRIVECWKRFRKNSKFSI